MLAMIMSMIVVRLILFILAMLMAGPILSFLLGPSF
jgi:hypothetical protein